VAEGGVEGVDRLSAHAAAESQDVGRKIADRIVLRDDDSLNIQVAGEAHVVGSFDIKHAFDGCIAGEVRVGVGRDADIHQVVAAAVHVGGVRLETVGVDGREFRSFHALVNMVGKDVRLVGGAAN